MRSLRATALIVLASIGAAEVIEAQSQRRREYVGPAHFRAFAEYENQGGLTKVVLRNGLTVLFEEHTLYPLSAIATYVRNDGTDQSDRAASRLLAQAFKRSWENSGDAFAVGAKVTVDVDRDRTLYLLTLPDRALLKGLDLTAALLDKPPQGVDAPGLLKQLSENERAAESRTERVLQRHLRSMEGLDQFDPESGEEALRGLSASQDLGALLTSIHAKTHRPERTVIAISGSVFPEGALKKIVDLYANRPGAGAPAAYAGGAASTRPKGFQYRFQRSETEVPTVLAGLPAVGRRHDDYPALELIALILGGGRSSLLNRFGVETGAILDFDVRLQASQDLGLLSIRLHPDPSRISEAEAQFLTQLKVLRDKELDGGEVQRAKALWLVDHYRRLQGLEKRAESLAQHHLNGGYLKRDKLPEEMLAVTPADIRRVARRYLQEAQLSLLESFPPSAEARNFTGQSWRETMQVLVDAAFPKQIERMDAQVQAARAEGKDRRASGDAAEPKSLDSVLGFTPRFVRSDLRRTSILRGPHIFFQSQNDVPLVDVTLLFSGGRSDESDTIFGITELMLQSMLREAGRSSQISWGDLERMGAVLETVNESEFFGFRATLLSPFREPFIGLLVDWLRKSQVSEEGLALEKTRLASRIARARSQPQGEIDWARRQLFAGDPFGGSRMGSPESLQRLQLLDVQAWKQRRIDEVHPWFLVRGDIEGTAFLQPFIRKLSNHRLRRIPLGQPKSDPDDDEYYDEDEEDEPESSSGQETISSARDGSVLIGFAGPTKGSREEWMLNVAANLLQGMGGRLEKLLQEPTEGSVPVRLLHESGLRRGAIYALANTSPERQDQLMDSIPVRLSKLKDAPLRPLDWNYALITTITDFHRRQQAGVDYTLELARNIVAGSGTRFEDAYLTAIRSAKPQDLQLLAAAFFAIDEEDEEDDEEPPQERRRR